MPFLEDIIGDFITRTEGKDAINSEILECIKLLRNGHVICNPESEYNALELALIGKVDPRIVRGLSQKFDLSTPSKNGTLLEMACNIFTSSSITGPTPAQKQNPVTNLIITSRTLLDQISKSGRSYQPSKSERTIMHFLSATFHNKYEELLPILHKINPKLINFSDPANFDERSPLTLSIHNGNLPFAQLLINLGIVTFSEHEENPLTSLAKMQVNKQYRLDSFVTETHSEEFLRTHFSGSDNYKNDSKIFLKKLIEFGCAKSMTRDKKLDLFLEMYRNKKGYLIEILQENKVFDDLPEFSQEIINSQNPLDDSLTMLRQCARKEITLNEEELTMLQKIAFGLKRAKRQISRTPSPSILNAFTERSSSSAERQ